MFGTCGCHSIYCKAKLAEEKEKQLLKGLRIGIDITDLDDTDNSFPFVIIWRQRIPCESPIFGLMDFH